MDIQSVLQQVVDAGKTDTVAQATSEHVATMSGDEVTQHLQTAAANASSNGQPNVAAEIQDLVSRTQSDPDSLKSGAVAYIKNNPQVLAQFAPAFAQGILAKV